jgi:hypothetical protein
LGKLAEVPPNGLSGVDLHELAAKLAEMLQYEQAIPKVAYTNAKLAAIAQAIYRARRRRDKFFGRDLFADPTWDMLLDLFVNQVRGVRVSVTSVTLAACVASTTGLRCIRILVERELVRRIRAPDDARLVLLELTPRGFQLMRQYLSDGILRRDVPTAE